MSALYSEISGKGDPIVFVHGFSLDHRMWRPQVQALDGRFKTVTYDMRGFGRSPLPDGPYSHHADLAELLREQDIASVHIVGLSMGGRVAIDFALEYPGMVRSLLLIDAAVTGLPGRTARNPDVETLGLIRARQEWIDEPLFEGSRKRPHAQQVLRQIVDDYSGWHWAHPSSESRLSPPALHRLSELVAPTLISVGREDVGYFQDTARVLHKGIAHSTLISIPEAGHMANLDNPAYVNKMIWNFLTQPEGSI